jgi:hypothetical protein
MLPEMAESEVQYVAPLAVPEVIKPVPHRLERLALPLGVEQLPVAGVFNGPLIGINNTVDGASTTEWHCFPRIMHHNGGNGVDITDAVGHLEVDPTTYQTKHREPIPVERIREGQPSMLAGGFNPEDLRGHVIDDRGTILFGLTAADKNGIPRAALMTATWPYRPIDFQPMQVLENLPAMKNILPLSEDLFVARRELVPGPRRELNFYQKNASGEWEAPPNNPTTPFPEVPWIGEKGRLGMVGWNEKVPVPGKEGRYRILIHGYKHEADDLNKRGEEIYEYSIGVAEIQMNEDGTFHFTGAAKKPIISYSEAVKQVKDATGRIGREPDPHKRVVYSVGGVRNDEGDIILPVTVFDRESHLFKIPQSAMLNSFSTEFALAA